MNNQNAINADESSSFNESRREVLRGLRLGMGSLGRRALLAGGFGEVLLQLLVSPVAADQSIDVQILQTASSLEILMVYAYQTVLDLSFLTTGSRVLAAFSQVASGQHDLHRTAFQAETVTLRGTVQTRVNAKYAAALDVGRRNLNTARNVIAFTSMLEEVVTATYASDMAMATDSNVKSLMAKVAGVEAQHLAILRIFGRLDDDGMPQLLNDLSGSHLTELPPSVGSGAVPEAFTDITNASPPAEGAIA